MISVIIQARMESERFPGKMARTINGIFALQILINRLHHSKYIDKFILATADTMMNRRMAEGLTGLDFVIYGSTDDVLLRVLEAARVTDTDIIVDITGDCPFVDYRQIDKAIQRITDPMYPGIDYISNVVTRSYFDGADWQVYTIKALEKVDKLITNKIHRSHVGWNILQYPDQFTILSRPAPPEYHMPDVGLTLDTREDLQVIRAVYKHFNYDITTSVEDISTYVKENPEVLNKNKHIQRKIPGQG